jgi:hypothetical protein
LCKREDKARIGFEPTVDSKASLAVEPTHKFDRTLVAAGVYPIEQRPILVDHPHDIRREWGAHQQRAIVAPQNDRQTHDVFVDSPDTVKELGIQGGHDHPAKLAIGAPPRSRGWNDPPSRCPGDDRRPQPERRVGIVPAIGEDFPAG